MLILLFPTPFAHFQFLGSAGRNPKLILTLCRTKLLVGEELIGLKFFCPKAHPAATSLSALQDYWTVSNGHPDSLSQGP